MSYLIIEKFGDPEYETIVTDKDGNNLVFDSYEDAEKAAGDCQDGLMVEID